MPRLFPLCAAALCAVSLSGCQFIRDDINKTLGRQEPRAAATAQLMAAGVNPYLWRAALDTLGFAPIISSDPASAVISTDWHVAPAAPNERMRVTVNLLDHVLRADALKVTAARQVNQNGQWVDAPVAAATVQRLEEIILTRAQALQRAAAL
jgi:hypothetical protein